MGWKALNRRGSAVENRSVGLPCPGDLNICHMKALVGLVLTGCLLKTAAFAGGGLSVTAFSWTRAHAGKLAFGRRLCTSQLTAQVERKDGGGSDRKILETAERTEPAKPWGDGGSGDNRLLQTLEFVIGSTWAGRSCTSHCPFHAHMTTQRGFLRYYVSRRLCTMQQSEGWMRDGLQRQKTTACLRSSTACCGARSDRFQMKIASRASVQNGWSLRLR